MNPEQLETYLQDLCNEMDLKDWVIEVADTKESEDNILASIIVTPGQRHANLWLSDEFWSMSPEDQCWVLVHELVHVHLGEFSTVIDATREALDEDAYSVLLSMFAATEERITNALALVIAKHIEPPGFG